MLSKRGPLGNIQMGQMTLPAVQGEVMDLPSLKESYGDKPAMIIGVDLLQRFRLIYEHSRNRFWLRTSTCPYKASVEHSASLGVEVLVSAIGLAAHRDKKLDHEKFLDLFEEVEIHVIDMLIRILTRRNPKVRTGLAA